MRKITMQIVFEDLENGLGSVLFALGRLRIDSFVKIVRLERGEGQEIGAVCRTGAWELRGY
jgi:hypothetical protein